MKFLTRNIYVSLLLFVMAGCAVLATQTPDSKWGPEQVQDRVLSTEKLQTLNTADVSEFHRDVKPIIEHRCVVCHACYDAPCQLKMESMEGIDRGANKTLVYDGGRLRSLEPSRLFEDALSTEAWRAKSFYPVLNERVQTQEANLYGGLMSRMLDLKQQHPLPEQPLLDESFDLSLNRDQQCPTIDEFDHYAKDKPLWGMPYGLPALSQTEHNTLQTWLAQGALYTPQGDIPKELKDEVDSWEAYFNGSSMKQKLVNRYMFEHLYLANLYFPDLSLNDGNRYFFKLVRSKTPPGQPIDIISTRRPFDDPGADEVFYRLRLNTETIVDKVHMPYRLDNARRDRWHELFYKADYPVTKLPGYAAEVSANPFDAFQQLPVKARYKFMLDEAQYTISGFIKGPVCRGQISLNVIRDHFWVVFVDPDNPHMSDAAEFIQEEVDYLRMPAGDGRDGLPVARWIKYSKLQQKYIEDRNHRINELFPNGAHLSTDIIWDGDGHNSNAALTIFRHFDSATVMKGHQGKAPLTTWLISYTLLERIHYLLVAGFDVYGNVSHQLLTRLYMDFLRMEAESNFLTLLPPDVANEEIELWNRGALVEVEDYLAIQNNRDSENAGQNPSLYAAATKPELINKIHDRLGEKVNPGDFINRASKAASQNYLNTLSEISDIQGARLNWLPEISLLWVESNGGPQLFTLFKNVSHSNVAHIFLENARIIEDEQSLTVLPGIVGSYPNVMFKVTEQELSDFSRRLQSLDGEDAYQSLTSDYAIRRTNQKFWQFSDQLHQWQQESQPVNYGLLDYNRLQNR